VSVQFLSCTITTISEWCSLMSVDLLFVSSPEDGKLLSVKYSEYSLFVQPG